MPEAKVCRHRIPWDLWKRWLFQCPSDCFRAWMWFLLGHRPSAVPPLLPRDPMTVVQLHPKLLSKRNTKEIAGKSSQRISLRPRSGGNKHHNFRSWWMQINWGWADKLMTHQKQIASGTGGISGQWAESWNPDKSRNALGLCPPHASRELLQFCALGIWLSASTAILFLRLLHPGMSKRIQFSWNDFSRMCPALSILTAGSFPLTPPSSWLHSYWPRRSHILVFPQKMDWSEWRKCKNIFKKYILQIISTLSFSMVLQIDVCLQILSGLSQRSFPTSTIP